MSSLDEQKQVVDQLVEAAKNGDKKEVERIVSEGKVTCDSPTKDGYTALMEAAGNGHKDICEFLISKGCNVDIEDKSG